MDAAHTWIEECDPEYDLNDTPCPSCGSSHTHSRDCWNCGGEGGFDAYDDDPFWYEPGDIETCDMCCGNGWLHWCPGCGFDMVTRTGGKVPNDLSSAVPKASAGTKC
jgi:hypothetical protein